MTRRIFERKVQKKKKMCGEKMEETETVIECCFCGCRKKRVSTEAFPYHSGEERRQGDRRRRRHQSSSRVYNLIDPNCL